MRVLVVGKGGREHALAKKISESKDLEKLWIAPGNPGMAKMGFTCVAMETNSEIVRFCKDQCVDLVVLGPEAAILSDLKLQLETQGIPCLAPTQEAAQLEASKVFCKTVLQEAGIKTAAFNVADDLVCAEKFLSQHDFAKSLVIKADGLAQGKGVHVCAHREQAEAAIEELSAQYGWPLLFEECLIGRELSAFALCDGEDFVILGTACDYKRINSDVFSANTGGMGAYSPCDFISQQDEAQINGVFKKTLSCMKQQGKPYRGFLFAGLMKTPEDIFVLEFNVRLGDPETQALLPRLKTDLLTLMVKAVHKGLDGQQVDFQPEVSVHVVAASSGYPGAQMDLGHVIELPSQLEQHAQIFFAGVSIENNQLVNGGGRVLGVTALASSLKEARKAAYQEIKKIHFKGLYFREDIAQ